MVPSQREDLSSDAGQQSSGESQQPVVSRRVETTGSKWTDLSLAMKVSYETNYLPISLTEDLRVDLSRWSERKRLSMNDFNHIGEVPCMRESLLRGIAAGLGVGVIRGLRVGAFSASNWAMGTFFVISVGSWQICQSSLRREREQVRVVVEEMAQRRMKKTGSEQQPPQQNE
ncbi:hypothetical protein SCHPADRAFT_944271 [Schizopora paradoxa]|uniref:Cytochrome c oxidase assembly protein COX20, mitochondrial n=1 Tax=Schizopora paradoxa TaxID=27342 RepID=A0A0H2RV42_9AGAM|nr:hypothetical protein SCHPADRAFT_944271 [Schizopora paradoxa]